MSLMTTPKIETQQQELQILKCVRQYGGSASDAVLDPHCSIFAIPSIEGILSYRFEPRCAVVYGDPMCRSEDLEQLVFAFHEICESKEMNVVYITASERFARWAMRKACKTLVEFGEELYLDPHDNPKDRTGVKGSLVRRKVRHAEKEGVAIAEYRHQNSELAEQIENVGIQWLLSREGPQIHTSNVHLFDNDFGKRWFYATCRGRVVGAVVLNQLQAHGGWLLNHLIHSPEAPNGTPELLLTHALEVIAEEGCHYVTFGAVPSERLNEMRGLGPAARTFAKSFFWVAHKIFHLGGRKMFWGKFHPRSKPSYLLFKDANIGFTELKALKTALNVSFSG